MSTSARPSAGGALLLGPLGDNGSQMPAGAATDGDHSGSAIGVLRQVSVDSFGEPFQVFCDRKPEKNTKY